MIKVVALLTVDRREHVSTEMTISKNSTTPKPRLRRGD